MDSFEAMILGKFFLTFGVLLGIPVWQLCILRRERIADQRAGVVDVDRASDDGGVNR